ncbi:hypothetical protein MIND_00172300 [Mycena indigotica]|uniref:Uncharacterized protein n=1 Tax=Mycena indigotica TaxID=2126181 RepID=A0A8H6TFE4_9AGAR|nr:uncharacterized protein MIND_00172300 [Mycena indigotica]KAF7316530.1 hypothetical protein MIND_00172300 [Mycena indigotica]
MAQAGTTLRQEKRSHSWGSSDHITSRIAWPLYIIFGQLALLLLCFGFLASVRSRGQIPLTQDAADFFTANPQVKSYVFTLLANALALVSSYLFTQAVRHAILVSLTRPLSLSTLGHGIIISRKSLILNRHYKWVAISGAIFIVSLGQTPGWSSLLTPNPISVIVPIIGREFDFTSPALQSTVNTLLNNGTIDYYLHSTLLSFVDASGAASSTAKAGYPVFLDFGGYAHRTSTRGILPVRLQDSAMDAATRSPRIVSNTAPLQAGVARSDMSLVMSQQGLTANVSCVPMVLSDRSRPTLHRTSQALAGGFTLWNVSTDCSVGQDSSDAVTRADTADSLFMVGCQVPSQNIVAQKSFDVIVFGQGIYSNISHVCSVTPQIQNMVANYTGKDLSLVSADFAPGSIPINPGPIAFAATRAMKSGFTYAQSTLLNSIGDSLLSIFLDQQQGLSLGTLLEAYITGIVEFTGTAIKTQFLTLAGNLGPKPSQDVMRPTNGTVIVHTIGYEYDGIASVLVLMPILAFSVLSIAIAIVAQFYNRGIPLTNADFDPNDPWLLMAAASAGGMSKIFHNIEEDDVEKGLSNRIMLGEVEGRDGFLHVQQEDIRTPLLTRHF